MTAQAILQEMRQRHESGDGLIELNPIIFGNAIIACLTAHDDTAANTLLRQMKQSATPPTIRVYTAILNHYAEAGTREAAERAQAILVELKRLAAQRDDVSLQPNAVTYSVVMKAWSLSGETDAGANVWGIFQQMKLDGIQPNRRLLTTLASYYHNAATAAIVAGLQQGSGGGHHSVIELLEKADLLLHEMANSRDADMQPDTFQYCRLIQSWLGVGKCSGQR